MRKKSPIMNACEGVFIAMRLVKNTNLGVRRDNFAEDQQRQKCKTNTGDIGH